MRHVLPVKAAAALLTQSLDADAQCATSQGYQPTSAATIGVVAGDGWTDPPPIESALASWTNGCPNMAGTVFPALLAGQPGDITISVHYNTGRMPDDSGLDSCARFNHALDGAQIIGGRIDVYQYTANGADCMWVRPHTTLDNLIAHELGHILGLANAGTGCGGIMVRIGHTPK